MNFSFLLITFIVSGLGLVLLFTYHYIRNRFGFYFKMLSFVSRLDTLLHNVIHRTAHVGGKVNKHTTKRVVRSGFLVLVSLLLLVIKTSQHYLEAFLHRMMTQKIHKVSSPSSFFLKRVGTDRKDDNRKTWSHFSA